MRGLLAAWRARRESRGWWCTCGHLSDLHEHWSASSHCGVCPCPTYRRDRR